MKVSICCITYNHGRYIHQTIDAILSQQVSFPMEIVISDDASTDNTLEVVEKYRVSHPSLFRVITHEQNVGMSKNFFEALRACKGEYIALCEGDDYWTDPAKLEMQVSLLDKNPGFTYSFSDACHVDEHDKYISDVIVNYPRATIGPPEIVGGFWTPTLTTVIRREPLMKVIDRIDADRFILNLDWVTFAMLSEMGPAGYVKTKPSAYRQHTGGIFSHRTIENKLKNSMNTRNYLRSVLKKENHKYLDSAMVLLYNNYLYGLMKNKQPLKAFVTEAKLVSKLLLTGKISPAFRAMKDYIYILKKS